MCKNRIRFLGVAAILVVTALPALAADWRPDGPWPNPQRWLDRDRIRQETVTTYAREGPQRRLLTMYSIVWSNVPGLNPDQSGIKYRGDPNALNQAMDCAQGRGYTLNDGKWYADSGRYEVVPSPWVFKLVCGR